MLSVLVLVSSAVVLEVRAGSTSEDGNGYQVFAELLESGQTAKAMELGRALFEDVVSRHAEHKGLRQVEDSLKSASEISELIVRYLERKQQGTFVDIAESGVAPDAALAPGGDQVEHFPPSAEQLYWDNVEVFRGEPDLGGISVRDARFVRQYRALKMDSHIEHVSKLTAHVLICRFGSSSLWQYSLVLSLFWLGECDERWASFDVLFGLADTAGLDAMVEFCLLRAERPETAKAIAKYKARSKAKTFSLVDWSVEAGSKCVEQGRADLAERLLRAAIRSICDESKIIELRLRIAGGHSRCHDHARAAQVCAKTAKEYPDSVFYGRLMHDYFSYLARQSQAEQILVNIDSELAKPACRGYLAELLYLKWWSLRKTGQSGKAGAIGERLIEQYGENRCVAPVLLARATDALSNQQYDRCRELLDWLVAKFPNTKSAQRGQEISASLRPITQP
jgi:hypothetical protein